MRQEPWITLSPRAHGAVGALTATTQFNGRIYLTGLEGMA
ncbi:hypothetical protein ActroDRAFT_0205 [Actinospica robiniae DSM 44927]|uniref:Uncharacterized protein n=1 Tax=Actinospica robiniae DSM 44927 TaxID=479430 RepID=W9DZC4_9ACTN|nr:hypothetical protein ActroDRAFT_0205 [Actinospica robiniae DSM 44927]